MVRCSMPITAVSGKQRLGALLSICVWPEHQYKLSPFLSATCSISRAHHAFITLGLTMLIGSKGYPSSRSFQQGGYSKKNRAVYPGTAFLLALSPLQGAYFQRTLSMQVRVFPDLRKGPNPLCTTAVLSPVGRNYSNNLDSFIQEMTCSWADVSPRKTSFSF